MDEATLRLTFPEAIAYLKAKISLGSTSWKTYEGQLQDVVFSISGITRASLLADVQAILVKQLETGITIEGFKRDFDAALEKAGWVMSNKGYRTELILQQNLRTSYSRGRWEQIQKGSDRRPYLEWRHRDSRIPREHHLAQDGKVYPADADVWKAIFPPNFGCKCTAHALSDRDLERLGLTVSEPPPLEDVADKGWGHGFSELPEERDRLVAEATTRLPPEFSDLLSLNFSEQPREPKGSPKGGQFASKKGVFGNTAIDNLALNSAITALETDENRENIGKFRDFVRNSSVTAVFYEPGTTQIEGLPAPPGKDSNGYAHKTLNSVVVRHSGDFNPNPHQIRAGVENAIDDGDRWSFSDAVGDRSNKTIVTYLHEMGHQIHYRDHNASILDAPEGWKAITEYGESSDTEFAAEHFVAWAIAPSRYKTADPIGYKWIDNMVNRALEVSGG